MDMTKFYREEDLFPREFAAWEERPYGLLFLDARNRDSYDSNHALLFRDRVTDLSAALRDIVAFYTAKGIRPILYQSISEEGYFDEIGPELAAHGFGHWNEVQKYMVLAEASTIRPNPEIEIRKISRWDESYRTEIFEKAGEPWEAPVAEKALAKSNTLFWVAYRGDRPVGMMHSHITEGVCRVDYLLVLPEARNRGVGRALTHSFVEYCAANHITDCYLWPGGETAERLYYEAGFRPVETKQAARAAYRATEENQ